MPDTAPRTRLRAQQVSVFYGGFQAIRSVDLDIPEGQVTAFIGPSGCGKSTLLRVLNRMNDTIPACRVEGRITLDGMDIYGKGVDIPELRRRVGMVFQKPNPFPMSIRDNVAYGLRIGGERDRAKIDAAVEDALRKAALWDEVADRLGRSAMGLSGGQQQRLCIARALAVQPEVILMDEPTSALDPIATARIEALIDALRQQLTVVIVTHNMQQAQRIADRTAFFYLGELIECAPTADLFGSPQQQRTADYVEGRFG